MVLTKRTTIATKLGSDREKAGPFYGVRPFAFRVRVFDNVGEPDSALRFFRKREAFQSRDSHGADYC